MYKVTQEALDRHMHTTDMYPVWCYCGIKHFAPRVVLDRCAETSEWYFCPRGHKNRTPTKAEMEALERGEIEMAAKPIVLSGDVM